MSHGFRLGFVTDVEGNLEYFLSYVRQSRVLKILEQSPQSLTLDLSCEDDFFVFGGDAVDKGPGDIRLVRALVDLQKRYPNQVFLLVGNRDLNKLRLLAELSDDDLRRPVSDIPPPHWDPLAPSLAKYLETNQKSDSRVNRLHYMLEHTLGCPQTFEFRRCELAILSNVDVSDVSDDQVVDSFLQEIRPGGSLWQYLECAKVAVVIGNTLFCHGAADRHTIQFVPRVDSKFTNPTEKPTAGAIIDNVIEWCDALNSFLNSGLEDCRQRPEFNSQRSSRGGEALLALQNRSAMWGRSIVSNCYGDGGCITTPSAAKDRSDPSRLERMKVDPLAFEKVCSDPMDQVVADWLWKGGIQRVVVGHKPTGDCPAVLSATYCKLEVVSGDTSFSNPQTADNRGSACGIVEISGNSATDNQLQLSGTLRDGTKYSSQFCRLFPGGVDSRVGDLHLGRQLKDGWWVKVSNSEHYFLTRGQGRQVEYRVVEKASLSK